MLEHKSILLANKINTLAILVVIGSILFYSASKYPIQETFNTIYPRIPGWIELDDDVGRDIFELIKSRGFEYESHFVETKDGYILQLVRLVNPFIKPNQTLYRPVILAHGIECTGSEFLMNNPGYLNSDGTYLEWNENENLINGSETITNTLGFTLASRGYDVWLVNFRGTVYSLNHTRLDIDDPEYWRFSMDEMIHIDLPSMIDYILNHTNHSSLSYIGHSQANILMLALMSESDHYQQLVKPFIALSPTWYLTNVRTILVSSHILKPYLKLSPGPLFFRDMKTVRSVLSTLCSNRMIRWICYNIYDLSVGYQTSDIRVDRFPVQIYNIPSGASNDNAIHHMQTRSKGQVSHYDYGLEKNLLLYNQSEPPVYNVSRINSTHMAFFQAINDRISSIEGNIQLKQHLSKPLLDDYIIDKPDFDHMSFVWSKYSGVLVNQRILSLLSLYNEKSTE